MNNYYIADQNEQPFSVKLQKPARVSLESI